MQFNSYLFILAVVPAFLLCYFLLSRVNTVLSKLVIIAFSGWFYVYGGWDSALILGISVAVNLLFSLLLSGVKKCRRLLLAAAILANAGLLLYFKYFNFALTIINDLFGGNFALKEIMLPLGISFFTFQQIMYVVSVYREEIRKVDVLDYLCCTLYFPKLIMGPLMEPKSFIDQINDRDLKRISWENIACGIKLFGFGLFKKSFSPTPLQREFHGALTICHRLLRAICSWSCCFIPLRFILISAVTATWRQAYPK